MPVHPDLPLTSEGGLPASLQACAYEAYLQSSSLGGDIEGIDHAQQLHMILATSGEHRGMIDAWCRRFAAMHDLDFQAAQRAVSIERMRHRATIFARKSLRALDSVIVERLPITNIHEAALAASVIRAKPGRRDSIRFLKDALLSRIGRSSGRSSE